MHVADLVSSLSSASPPKKFSLPLQALWWDAKGEWAKAHECCQADEEDPDNQWVHAYLHRKEGDQSNAGYWYRRCGRSSSQATLEQEWREIARALLKAD